MLAPNGTPLLYVSFAEEDEVPDPTPNDGPTCDVVHEDTGAVCTRRPHAGGAHLAGAGDYLAVIFTTQNGA